MNDKLVEVVETIDFREGRATMTIDGEKVVDIDLRRDTGDSEELKPVVLTKGDSECDLQLDWFPPTEENTG